MSVRVKHKLKSSKKGDSKDPKQNTLSSPISHFLSSSSSSSSSSCMSDTDNENENLQIFSDSRFGKKLTFKQNQIDEMSASTEKNVTIYTANVPNSPFKVPPIPVCVKTSSNKGSTEAEEKEDASPPMSKRRMRTRSSSGHSNLNSDESKNSDSVNCDKIDLNNRHDFESKEHGPTIVENPKKKSGIVYLSSVPQGFNVSHTTAFFSQFGVVGRVFLQPVTQDFTTKESTKSLKKKNEINNYKYYTRQFSEGWVEFARKSVAKKVASLLNATPVDGALGGIVNLNKKRRRRTKNFRSYEGAMWNIKYLPKFKWFHLSERLAYERVMHQDRMRNEISAAKRTAEHFKSNVERSEKAKRAVKKAAKIASKPIAISDTGSATTEGIKKSAPYDFKQNRASTDFVPKNSVLGQENRGSSSLGKSNKASKNSAVASSSSFLSENTATNSSRVGFLRSVFG